MRNCHLILIAAALLTALSGIGWSMEYPSVRNPIGSATMPLSGARSGLTRSPSPIDTSGNLTITGNIRGGRYFRGEVPYRSGTSFGATLGSTSLDSFLRDSASSQDFGRYSSRYAPRPYYSPTGTVTGMMPGRSGVFTPSSLWIDGDVREIPGQEALPKNGIALRQYGSDWMLRPMSLTPEEIERVTRENTQIRLQGDGVTSRQYKDRVEMLLEDLRSMRREASTFRQRPLQSDALDAFTQAEPPEMTERALETPQPGKETPESPDLKGNTYLQKDNASDLLEQIKSRLENLEKGIGGLPAVEETQETAKGNDGAVEEKPHFTLFADTGDTQKDSYKWESLSVTGGKTDEGAGASEQGVSALDEIDELSDEDLHAMAKRIMGPHKSLASFSEARFNQHLATAEAHLKAGEYYRASDSYALASIYKSGDVRPYMGKSYALLAAGEYVSSALFLSRALEISAEYVLTKADIAAALGDRDKLESRIADLKWWSEKSKSGELEFLLGYVYYMTGRPQEAKAAIESAFKKMPTSTAVDTVKKAIDNSTEPSKGK
jgi:tetratricopeptide (TPR) repeat protein